MKIPDSTLPNIIKIGAVMTAAPRWVGALLAAEGFGLPDSWLVWWIPASAILSACMAIVEGLAFAYVFEAWRNQTDRDSDNLLWFSLISAVVFVGVLAPYIAAQVSQSALSDVLTGWVLYAWSIAVGLSTIAIVASVGYAQKKRTPRAYVAHEISAVVKPAHDTSHSCAHCGASFRSQQALAAHTRWKHAKTNL